jgi:translocation and assembly module TamB
LKATASGPLEAAGVVTAEAALSELPLAPLIRELLPGAAGLDGSLSARATARVPLTDPRRGEGVLSIEPVRLVAPGQTWDGRGPVEVRWAQGGLRLARLNLAGGEGEITGAGTLGPDGALDVRARARLPLAMLPAMRPEVREAGGHLDLSLRVSGTASAPALAGDGAVHEGKLLLRNRAETVRDLEARLNLSGQRIELREASAAVGGGRVQARGEASVAGGRIGAYRLRLAAQNVALATVPGLASAWDADLELSGIAGDARLQGEARLVRGVYSRDLSLLSIALKSRPPEAAAVGPPLQLRVRVDLDDNLLVKNRTAELRAGGVLSVEGTAARPVVFGSVESRDGRIAFRGHDWNVETAAARFADPRRIDPILDVVATSRIREYDVTVQMRGRSSDLVVRLSSSPSLAQDDLLALISFGATRAELKQSPGSVLLGEAGRVLAQDFLGLNPGAASGLRVSSGSAGSATTETRHGPFEERAPGSGSRTTPGDRKEQVRIEYQMLDPLFLSGEYDLDGGYGADIVLRFRFR